MADKKYPKKDSAEGDYPPLWGPLVGSLQGHHSPFTVHRLWSQTGIPLWGTIHHSPFTIYGSPFTAFMSEHRILRKLSVAGH